MKKEKTFAEHIKIFEHHFDPRTVFDDFLTLTICAFGQKPGAGKSYDEDLYLETIAKYKDDKLRFEFSHLLSCLTMEMTERMDSDQGWDVLGEFYEQNLQRKGLSQFFTPWHICTFMAKSTCEVALENGERSRTLRILDPSCGSGRTLMAASRVAGPCEDYFGIDIDQTCVKMSAINLFLSGMFRIEVMCGNALLRDDFKVSYRTSFVPFGLFRVQEKQNSRLWQMMQNSSANNETKPAPPDFNENRFDEGSQLTIF